MNVRRILTQAFFKEWSILRDQPMPHIVLVPYFIGPSDFSFFVKFANNIFDFESVQHAVDEDLKNRVGRERKVYERYHRQNLRFLSRLYANKLYQVSNSGMDLSENSMREALKLLKPAWACPYYPCMRA